MIGLIRVLTTEDEQVLQSHARSIDSLVGDRIVTRALPDQPHGIYDDASLAVAEPKVIEAAEALVNDGATMIIVSCAADPAVAALRQLLQVPVIGAGSAGAAIARSYASKVGVLGITDEVPSCITDLLGNTLVGARVPDGVHQTTDLMTPEGEQAALRAAQDLVDDGAQCILFACTDLTTIGLAGPITEKTGVPVIDAVLAAGHAASYPLSPSGRTHVNA
jgi:Asp/Glu/hydantoin racemase